MKIILGDKLRKILKLSKSDAEEAFAITNPDDIAQIEMRLQQALAATCPEDMAFPFKLVSRTSSGKRWIVELKLKFELPLPVALEFQVIDERSWEIELVTQDGTHL